MSADNQSTIDEHGALPLHDPSAGRFVVSCESTLPQTRLDRASAGVPCWVEPDYALGRQLYALRRCWDMSPIVYTGTVETALEGRLLRS